MPSTPISSSGVQVHPSWSLLFDLQQLFAFHFMQNAFLAGTLIALAAGAAGYFMVLRGQSFAGHTLANVGFAGAAGAAVVGATPVVGLLVFCVAAAVAFEPLAGRGETGGRGAMVAIASVHSFFLGLGFLFERLYAHYAGGIYAILFGAVLGISDADVQIVTATAVVTLTALLLLGRPLLFASIDPAVAASRGVPVRLVSMLFLILLALAVAEAVQVVGVLLIFSLLVTPGAIARRLSTRTAMGVALAMLLALLFTWAGLAVAYFTPYPVGFFISSFAFGTYILTRLLLPYRSRRVGRYRAAPARGTA
ncbi:MAG: metal ABC transporter permease [Chloroflexota bacterium]